MGIKKILKKLRKKRKAKKRKKEIAFYNQNPERDRYEQSIGSR